MDKSVHDGHTLARVGGPGGGKKVSQGVEQLFEPQGGEQNLPVRGGKKSQKIPKSNKKQENFLKMQEKQAKFSRKAKSIKFLSIFVNFYPFFR